ncbi:MAG: radical SAM protein [Candidatus Aminicenantes bacterium]|jgi:radical SAM superfamily enzyme YgiQ (UPF0313 family)
MARILLIYPPVAEPFSPYLSLPELSAVLKHHNHRVYQLDLNLLAYHKLLSCQFLTSKFKQIKQWFQELNGQKYLASFKEQYEYEKLSDPITFGEYVITHIDEAKRAIRDITNYKFDPFGSSRLRRHWQIFDMACRLLFHSPLLNPYLYPFEDSASCFMSVQQIDEGVKHPEKTIFFQFFRDEVFPAIHRDKPQIVGLSLTFADQVIPTFILSHMIKKEFPDCHITIGGNIVSLLWREIKSQERLFDHADSFVIGDGEPALLELANQFEQKAPRLEIVPNLMFKMAKNIRRSDKQINWNISHSPPPDFTGLPLDDYFLGKRQLVYMTGRGCYWGKCRFCDFSITKPGYRSKSPEKVVRDLEYLSRAYQSDLFYLADDAIAPVKVWRIATEILKRNLKITWWCLTRFDEGWSVSRLKTIEKSGCYRLFFGMESANTRVQELVNKGFTTDRILEVLEMLKETNLHVHLSSVIGLPTETVDEAKQTLDFIYKHSRQKGFSGRVHVFRLTAYSEFATNPGLGVKPMRSSLDELGANYPFYSMQGLTQEEVRNRKRSMHALKAKFDEKMSELPLHCYPEKHNYEGLQFYFNYKGKIPKVSEEVKNTGINFRKAKPKLNHWIVKRDFNFNVNYLSELIVSAKRQYEELVFFNQLSSSEAFKKISMTFCPLAQEKTIYIKNVMNDKGIFLDEKARDLLNLLKGAHTPDEIKDRFLKTNAEINGPDFEYLFATLMEFGFIGFESQEKSKNWEKTRYGQSRFFQNKKYNGGV